MDFIYCYVRERIQSCYYDYVFITIIYKITVINMLLSVIKHCGQRQGVHCHIQLSFPATKAPLGQLPSTTNLLDLPKQRLARSSYRLPPLEIVSRKDNLVGIITIGQSKQVSIQPEAPILNFSSYNVSVVGWTDRPTVLHDLAQESVVKVINMGLQDSPSFASLQQSSSITALVMQSSVLLYV